MRIPFVKMHGAGNDFVLIDDRDASFPADGRVIAVIAPRGVGIGCETFSKRTSIAVLPSSV